MTKFCQIISYNIMICQSCPTGEVVTHSHLSALRPSLSYMSCLVMLFDELGIWRHLFNTWNRL